MKDFHKHAPVRPLQWRGLLVPPATKVTSRLWRDDFFNFDLWSPKPSSQQHRIGEPDNPGDVCVCPKMRPAWFAPAATARGGLQLNGGFVLIQSRYCVVAST